MSYHHQSSHTWPIEWNTHEIYSQEKGKCGCSFTQHDTLLLLSMLHNRMLWYFEFFQQYRRVEKKRTEMPTYKEHHDIHGERIRRMKLKQEMQIAPGQSHPVVRWRDIYQLYTEQWSRQGVKCSSLASNTLQPHPQNSLEFIYFLLDCVNYIYIVW